VDERPAGEGSDAPPPVPARQARARRRRHRRVLGTLLFFAVAIGIFAAAYFVLIDDDSSDRGAATATSAGVTSTTVHPAAGPYRVTTGVNVRKGPGTTFPTVGTIETGHVVFVSCVVDGEPVDAPTGPVTKWLRLTGFGPVGYLTVAYVDVGDDLSVEGKIPVCSA
jgi:hypothetical protein